MYTKIRVFTAFSGYDSQCLALERLHRDFPEIEYELVGWSEIDKENSTFECIKFKPIAKRWRDSVQLLNGVYVIVQNGIKWNTNYYQFATDKQAKSALAMAQISQIMANDDRFGGMVTDKEWEQNGYYCVIFRRGSSIAKGVNTGTYRFLAFHTVEQRDLFLEENEDLVKDYLMID